MKNISIIVSISDNGAIGKNNELLWKQSADLKRFKDITTGHPVIMGQKTYESIGKLLPNRMNIIISDDPKFTPPYGAYLVRSIEQAMGMPKNFKNGLKESDEEIFIIGGGSIYKQFLPHAQKLYVTKIHINIDGDTYFPDIDENEWEIIFKEDHKKDDKNEYDYTYEIYERN